MQCHSGHNAMMADEPCATARNPGVVFWTTVVVALPMHEIKVTPTGIAR
jgi:hypothetical protein